MNNHLQQSYLDAMGIQSWQLKSTLNSDIFISSDDELHEIIEHPQPVSQEPQGSESEPLSIIPDVASKNVQSSLINSISAIDSDSELYQSINNCKHCSGRQTRLNALSGQGNSSASVFVIGDAPDAEEDRCGHYLSEQGLSLFQSMLCSINSNDDYFFTGIIKCYSISDFLVSKEDISHCASFLQTQIAQIKPEVLLVLGAVQAQAMLSSKQSFNELRGKVHQISINKTQYPLIVSYHPAYLLRNPLYKGEALKDLIMLKKLIK